ncbi:hypothetical protein [Bacillus haynesii]|uniref:hypothetical protein n=1 Tax=Bacillus haynesii TaxID=1925021 RepID=UPI00227FE5E4|nr:hypothetical protein [Bacillus haynesii]MCY7994091.1 hypothetical protein [Bacillus haynesii]MCY8644548.1 hypothetical protein [Bacillus haynesii]
MCNFENGGAIAIKGFNFQKAAITFIAIKNFDKPNFHILVETKDDFEVKYNGYDAYIQVKSQKLSLKKLLNSNDGKSILEKNLSNGSTNSHFKIFVKGFVESDIKKMVQITEGNICSPLYSYNDEQKNTILEKLKGNENIKEFEEKLLTSYLYIPPFKDKLSEAITVLLGEMALRDIDVSHKRGQVAINELFTLIDQKSEFIIKTQEDYKKKEILKKDLKEIFKLSSTLDAFDELLKSTSYSFFYKKQIKKEQLKIIHSYANEKQTAKELLEDFDLFNGTEEGIIDSAIEKCNCNEKFNNINEFAKKAIVIEVLVEMSEIA